MKLTMRNHLILLLIGLGLIAIWAFRADEPATNSQQESTAVEWLTIQELNDKAQDRKWSRDSRMIFVDLYTEWCGWCKRMDATTFADPAAANYLNKHFYAVKMDAETRETITFGDQQYEWMNSGRNGMNRLGQLLGTVNGRIAFPTVVFLDENLRKIQAIPGYKSAEDLLPMLVYYAEEHYRTTPWDTFLQSFDPASVD